MPRALLDLAGGTRDGRPVRAVLLGGAAGVFVAPSELDMPLSLEATRAAGQPIGSGGLDRATTSGRAAELVALLQMEEASKRPLAEYSHGMRKRAAFALAVLHDPAVLILDEPFEGLDPIGVRVMLANLQGMARAGRTVFITSHILGLVERLCTSVAIIDAGRVAWQGKVEDARVDASTGGPAGASSDLERLFLKVTGSENAEPLLSWVRCS